MSRGCTSGCAGNRQIVRRENSAQHADVPHAGQASQKFFNYWPEAVKAVARPPVPTPVVPVLVKVPSLLTV